MGKQLALFPVKRKRRAGKPGRKVRGERVGFVRHRTRPVHDRHHPVHVTIRRVRLAPSFRTQRIGALILQELKAARAKGVRVIEHSIQDDHLHLMVEGNDAADLSAQIAFLALDRPAWFDGIDVVSNNHFDQDVFNFQIPR